MKKICIFSNHEEKSDRVAAQVAEICGQCGIECLDEYSPDAEGIIAVGGDGSFLNAVAGCGYPDIPVLGINTGHLGFFQELQPDELGKLPALLAGNDFSVQRHRLIEASVVSGGERSFYTAINDVALRDCDSRVVHLNLAIGSNFIERFSGDGILIASSAGSTAYNYSLGGSIVDPRLDLIQLTPMAPMNNTIYRSFTSSLLLPADMKIDVTPNNVRARQLTLLVDGVKHIIPDLESVSVGLSDRQIQIVRLPGYDFWGKVQSKFL